MPIRPEYRKYYAGEWRDRRLRMIEASGNRCAICQQVFPPSRLSGAHMRHNPRDPSQVKILCFADHARHDAAHRLAVVRRRRAARFGQLWLLPELQWAATPAWAIPREAIAAIYAQGRLF